MKVTSRLAGLDGLRAIAVLAVLLFHAGVIEWGWIGVNLFFVLSGFLISRILLDAKATGAGPGAVLTPFYTRRALRILPLAWLGAAIVAFITGEWLGAIPYAAYYVNWLPALPPEPRALRHYWTLAVEEQFYLLWPLAVLALSRRTLAGIVAAVVVIGAMLRAWLAYAKPEFATMLVLGNPLLRIDPLLVGALIAIIGDPNKIIRLVRIVLPFAAATMVTLLALNSTGFHRGAVYVVQEPVIAVTFGAALLLVLVDPPRWLSSRPLTWIGSISYGIYVIHGCLSPWFNAHISLTWLRAILLISVSLFLASASWRFLEAPLLALKSRWPMPVKPVKSSGNVGLSLTA